MEFGTALDLEWLADIGLAAEAAVAYDEGGLDFVGHGGHVLTAAPGRYPDRPTPTYGVPFRDPFVLYTHLAAKTERLRFRSGILILPMYPTVLVAKQAADLAIASAGRFELGVGISWQEAEYRAMGQPMRARGARLEEQLHVLRQLWNEPLVTFHGRFHDIDGLGVGQLPPPIPVWIGSGAAPALLDRVARLADGWMPIGAVDFASAINEIASRRPPSSAPLRVAARVTASLEDLEPAIGAARAFAAAGVSALSIAPPPGSDVETSISAVLATKAAIQAALA